MTMTQDAIVTKVYPDGMAEVTVLRGTACGSNCGNCKGCIYDDKVKTLATNHPGAKPGQKVVIGSKSYRVLCASILVYIIPMLLMLLGYALAAALGAGEGLSIVVSFLGLLAGAAVTVRIGRTKEKDPIPFDILSIC